MMHTSESKTKHRIIQLQRLNPVTEENEGGLYINTEFISELVPVNSQVKYLDRSLSWTVVNMSNGNSWLTPFSITEVFDLMWG